MSPTPTVRPRRSRSSVPRAQARALPPLRPVALAMGWAVAAAVALAAFAPSARAHASEPAIGQVSLVIGSARVVHLDGRSEPLKRGATIVVGDRVETTANGHVHLRFIDNASVSVRPDSVLEVQSYHYDAARPQANEVRLRVEQGTARSISGAATEVDKSRFRLNTPIAAIGVRGTDFIVHSSAAGARATVADGAIVVSALGNGCSAAALGPCTGADARVLTAEMGRLMAEVRPGERVARVVPAGAGVAELAASGAEERAAALYAAELAARQSAAAAADAKGFAQMRDTDRAAADLLAIVPTAVADLNVAPDLSAQLVWGRWAIASAYNDNISVATHNASPGREVTSAYRSGDAVLWRATDPANPEGLLKNDTDVKVDFKLTRAQASFESGGRTEAASVDGGTLTLDFSQRTFATALALSSPSAGKAELRVAGDVATDGTFAVRDAGQMVSGAVSLNSKEVGYLFDRSAGGGLFRGKTLWGR